MKSVEKLREFFRQDRYATDATGIEILEAETVTRKWDSL